ncbi:MAG: molybdate ABC transporter substrate-binding protein [Dehalococcoidia bacterium]
MPWRITLVFLIGFSLAIVAACGDDDAPSCNGDSFVGFTVFAASSLTEAFEAIEEHHYSGCSPARLSYNFAGSQALRTQLEQGASASVFASANARQLDLARESGVVKGTPVVFARNRLVVIVPTRNKAGIEDLQDLANDGLKIIVAGEDVPAGEYTRQFLENASSDPAFGADYGEDVLANVVSEETNVRQVVARVELDEADAGIVYATDVTDAVTMIEIPDELNEIAEYFVAAINGTDSSGFIDFVLSDEGQSILEDHGFMRVDQ